MSSRDARTWSRRVGGAGKAVRGKLAAHRDWFMSEGWRLQPEILWTREEAGAAWALTRVTYSENGNTRMFLLLFLFVDEDGNWRVVYDQNTPIT